MNVSAIATASKNIYRLAFGAVDYCLDIGISVTGEEHEFIYPRSSLVVSSKAAGLLSPIDTVYVNIHNEEGLIKQTNIAKQMGMFAKLCIHPKQVDIIHQLYSIPKHEINWAKDVVKAFEQAELKGNAAINLQGEMIDYPVYKRALAILNQAARKEITAAEFEE